MMMFQSQQQQQQQQRQYQHGNTSGTSVSEWIDDYMRLKTKLDEYNTELTKFSNKYGYHHNGNHDMQRGAESGMASKKRERWTTKEHELFVIGVAKYGKGRWKRISEDVLPSKTPSQIASHAQKYFIRQEEAAQNKKRRRSIHDDDIITTTVNVNECHDQAMPSFVHSHNHYSVPPPLPPPPPHNCNNWDDVAAPPQDHQLHHQPTVVHAEKKSCDEAMVLPPLPHDYWDQLPDIVDVPPLCDDQQELQQQQQDHQLHHQPTVVIHAEKELSSCDEAMVLPHLPHDWYQLLQDDITTQQEEEPDFMTYLNNSTSHSSPAAVHAAEKESSCDEAEIISLVDDLPPLPQELQLQQQMYGYGTFDITRQEEEPIFINYINSLSHSPFDNIAFPGPEPTSPPRFT